MTPFWLGHKNIIEYCNRPFANIEDMNKQLIERWNETVDWDDTVNEMEYIYIYKDYSSIRYEDIRWLLKRLLKNNLVKLFEMLALQVSWNDRDFTYWDEDKKMMKKVKKILRRVRRK